MAYRDDAEALTLRVELLRERIAELEGPLSPLWLQELGADLRAELEVSRQAHIEAAEPTAHLAALEQHLALLERLHAGAPELEAGYNALPAEAELALLGEPTKLPWLALAPMDGPRALERVPTLLREIDQEAQVTVVSRRSFVLDARFHHHAVPVVLRVQPFVGGQNNGELELVMATTVRRSTPALDLRPLAWLHSLTTMLGVHRDVFVGDDDFDNRFLVQCEADQAPRLLPPTVRSELLRIAKFDVPSLVVGEGKAVLRWLYDCTLPPIEAGARVLAHLRGIRRRVRLVER